jgi:MoaA/NifB/PqqE/SkfB family radical SAM enzyme
MIPGIVFWYATERCDLRCKHCCYPPTGKRELNTNEGKYLIEELAEMGVPNLAFIGGEPILRGDIFELCSYCADNGIQPHLITKGHSLKDEDCKRLSEIGVQVTLGIDTFTHRTADTICGIEELPRFSEEALNNCIISAGDI